MSGGDGDDGADAAPLFTGQKGLVWHRDRGRKKRFLRQRRPCAYLRLSFL